MKFFLIIACMICFLLPAYSSLKPDISSDLSRVENLVFGMSYPSLKDSDRLSKIEKPLFGKIYSTETPEVRTKRINEYLLGYYDNGESWVSHSQEVYENKSITQAYENLSMKEISSVEFEDLFLRIVNNERSFKGLLPVVKDETAMKVSLEHASDLLVQGHASFFNQKKQGPDERYTLAGGTGALIEVIKGFEVGQGDEKIKLSETLAKQLIEAISISTDDAQILYNPHITHIGYGFALSKDKTKFVSVLDFLTKGGSLEPIKISVNLSQKINISGKLRKPYRFKAVTVGYLSEQNLSDLIDNYTTGFDSQNVKPYFPPQDYIAYADKSKTNTMKILQGIGFIGALGAAPFTGGATSFLAPVFLNSLQSGPPKEIPLKGGMKSDSDGSFYGNLELNYQGKPGLYYISVIADMPGLNTPIVISRRTVRVGLPLVTSKDIH